MRNDNSCFIFQVGIKVADDFFLRAGIYGRQAVVEDEYTRIFDQGPGNGNTLLLTSAECYAPLPYFRIESFIETQDVFFYGRLSGCQLHLLQTGRRISNRMLLAMESENRNTSCGT